MDRLARNRRPKTGDKTNCLPAGDGLPIWSTIPLDKKLPMMSNPKGSVVLYTTYLGQPKHRCKQTIDFDLRDPNGKYICSEYKPLHDPHLKPHFSSEMMRKHLIRKGFISEDGKVLCSLKEFNQYRRYLRHIFFLEIARERKVQLENYCKMSDDEQKKAELNAKISRGGLVRRKLQQMREHDMSKVNKTILFKAERLDRRLQEIREEMVVRERHCRELADRRQMQVIRTQQETERRNQMMVKKWRQKERLRSRLLDERENQRCLRAEMKCLSKWNSRKEAQRRDMERDDEGLKLEEDERIKNIEKRDKTVAKQRHKLESKFKDLKQTTRQEKQKKDEQHRKRFEEKLASGDFRIWTKRKERRRLNVPAFQSTWKLQDVLTKLTDTDGQSPDKGSKPVLMFRLNAAIDSAVDIATRMDDTEDAEIKAKAHDLVQGVMQKVKNELFPAFMDLLDDTGAVQVSRSVRFSGDEEEIPMTSRDSGEAVAVHFRPVQEHILTPVPSQLEIQQLEEEAILESDFDDKITQVSFVETLLLRLLDDLNSGRLSKDDIMKLASYSMHIIKSPETDQEGERLFAEINEEAQSEDEEPYSLSSSSSLIAKQMVDFTLSRILDDILAGNVITDDLLSLTVSVLDDSRAAGETDSENASSTDLEDFIDNTIRHAASGVCDSRDDSPICDALLDDFMVNTLKNVMHDLEAELLSKSQLEALAVSVKEETKYLLPCDSDEELTSAADLQNVLQNIVQNLQSGEIDLQALYKIVFAIVYSYNMLKTPQTPCFEQKVTELMKDVFSTVEQKASHGDIKNVNIELVHEANRRLSSTILDVHQIERLSSTIVGTIAKPDIVCKTSTSDIARSIVEDALSKAKTKLLSDENDEQLVSGVQEVATAVISTLPDTDGKSQSIAPSPPLTEVLIHLLQQLKVAVDSVGDIEGVTSQDIDEIMMFMSSSAVDAQLVQEMATSVSRVVMSPMRSDSSFIADMAVKDIVKKVGSDLAYDKVEDDIIADMLNTIVSSYRAAQAIAMKPTALLNSLAYLLRNILGHITYKIQVGEFKENDIHELSQMMKGALEEKRPREPEPTVEETEVIEEPITVLTAETLVVYLTRLMDEFECDGLDPNEATELGNRLMECGKKIVATLSQKISSSTTPGTTVAADNVVEEVILSLQREIDTGQLTNESLKEIAKSIISSNSDSIVADGLVNKTIRGIYRDVERGVSPVKISSVPTIDHTPSASTIADHFVMQTIDAITRDLAIKGFSSSMAASIASSILSIFSAEGQTILPAELEKFRKTITRIIDCLSQDALDPYDANKIFCLILENYQTYVLKTTPVLKLEETDSLSEEAIVLIENLVSSTLQNIQRSMARGRLDRKQYSIPSAVSTSECNASTYVEELVERTLANIKAELSNEKPTQQYGDIVSFILDVVNKLQKELLDGTISNLSIGHFYQAISDDRTDLQILEVKAKQNLEAVINDIREKRSSSKYVKNILNTYLTPDQPVSGVFTDPVKAVESILISVSSEILTKFVKATLQNILIEMREGNLSLSDKAPSGYVLRSASSIVAENVIHNVLSKIKNEMSSQVSQVKGGLSKSDFERVASKIVLDVPKTREHRSSPDEDNKSGVSRHSRSSVISREVGDIILETLHNICSNLLLEQSMLPQKNQRKVTSDEGSEHSQEIQDFVLGTLQNIMTDLQDKRSLAEVMMPKPDADIGTASGVDLQSVSSRDASVYVNTVLQDVLGDMKRELVGQDISVSDKHHDDTEVDIELMIVDALQHAVTDSTTPKSKHGLEPEQEEGVRKIVIESVKRTISNVQDNKIKLDDLNMLFRALSKYTDSDETDEDPTNVDVNSTVILLESVLTKIETLGLDGQTLERISTQLATLGMESLGPCEDTSPNEMISDVSLKSSAVSDLVREVITKISRQLSSELLTESKSAHNATANVSKTVMDIHSNVDENSGKIPTPSSSGSTAKGDAKNFNRKMSETSGVTEKLSTLSDQSIPNEGNTMGNAITAGLTHTIHQNTPQMAKYTKCRSINCKNSPETTLYKRKVEPNHIHRMNLTTASSSDYRDSFEKHVTTTSSRQKLKNYTPTHSTVRKTVPRLPNADIRNATVVRNSPKSSIPKPIRKETPLPANNSKRISQIIYNATAETSTPHLAQAIYSGVKPPTIIKRTEQQMTPKQRKKSTTKPWSQKMKKSSKEKNVSSPNTSIPPVVQVIPEDPFEVRSLCGVHKTRIRLLETVSHEETTDDYSTSGDDYSYTSQLF